MAESALPRSAPGAQEVDARGVLAFLDAVEAAPEVELHGLMVLRHGAVVAEGWWAPYSADRVHLLYSLSKTFTATALGYAVAEGLVGLDDAVADHFPAFAAELPDASRGVLVRHVAAMASGHRREMIEAAVLTDPAEPVRGFLLNPPEEQPGSVFAYNQPCTYSIAAIVQRESGSRLTEYLRPRLLDPLGIGPVAWQQYPPGRDLGFSGLHARTEDVAKLGQLHLEDGVWRGERVMPAGWAGQMAETRIATPAETEPDWRQGYGFQVWRSRHGYRADGAYGQFCLVLPDQDAVVAITGATLRTQALLDAVWEHLLPALTAGAGRPEDEAALAERLAALELPVVRGGAAIDDTAAGSYAVPIGDAQGMLEAVGLARRGDAWEVVLRTPGGDLRAAVGEGAWARTEADGQPPVAISGAAAADGSVHVDVVLLETPHRLEVEFDPGERRARARWATEPLGLGLPDALLMLRAPWDRAAGAEAAQRLQAAAAQARTA